MVRIVERRAGCCYLSPTSPLLVNSFSSSLTTFSHLKKQIGVFPETVRIQPCSAASNLTLLYLIFSILCPRINEPALYGGWRSIIEVSASACGVEPHLPSRRQHRNKPLPLVIICRVSYPRRALIVSPSSYPARLGVDLKFL